MKTVYTSVLFLLLATLTRADVPLNNFWPNPTFETGDTLDQPEGTPANWSRGGSNPEICQVTTSNSVSSAHSLIVNDTIATGYGEWYSDLDLTGLAAGGDDLDLHWFEMFSITGGEMRLTLLFFDANNATIGQQHFVTTGNSVGWKGSIAASPFVSRTQKVAVPQGTSKIRLSLVSGGPSETKGVMVIDDLSVARHPKPILLAKNFWINPSFELGQALGTSAGTPSAWNRGGNNPALCQVTSSNSVSPTHSLLVNDTDDAGYAEWYSDQDLTGHAAPGDEIDLQWFQIYSTSGGEMRLTVIFLDQATNSVSTYHFVVNGDSPDFTGDIATSPLQQRKERLPVAAGAVKMRISLVSGGPQTATGFLLIDDLSVAKVLVTGQEILADNFRFNPTFEEGDNLDQPTGTPAGWSRGGTDATIDQVSTIHSVSTTHSLAVVDTNEAGYGEWYSDQSLPCSALEGRLLNLQWYESFDITGGEMRLSVLFFDGASTVVAEHHYPATGQSAGFTGTLATSPFVRRSEQVVVPAGAKVVRFSLVSGGAESVTGTMLVDNLSAAVAPTPATLLFGTLWPNGAFEDGATLDQPVGSSRVDLQACKLEYSIVSPK